MCSYIQREEGAFQSPIPGVDGCHLGKTSNPLNFIVISHEMLQTLWPGWETLWLEANSHNIHPLSGAAGAENSAHTERSRHSWCFSICSSVSPLRMEELIPSQGRWNLSPQTREELLEKPPKKSRMQFTLRPWHQPVWWDWCPYTGGTAHSDEMYCKLHIWSASWTQSPFS